MYEEYLKKFKKDFQYLSSKYGEQTVFADFVKMCAISMYNVFAKNQQMEQEYLNTINAYDKEAQQLIPRMFGNLIMMYQTGGELTDIFSKFYSFEQLGSKKLSQFFTPNHISEFMGQIAVAEEKNLEDIIEKNGFITMSEPSCGAGRYDIRFC